MTNDLETRPALFSHDEPGPRFARKDVVTMISASGVPTLTAVSRLNRMTTDGLIEVRDHAGAHARFAPTDAATAIVISAMQDMGVADKEALQIAKLACTAGSLFSARRNAVYRGDHASPHPIAWALRGIERGESWMVRLDFWRSVLRDTRIIDADLHHRDDAFIGRMEIAPEFTPVGTIAIVLDELLLPVVYRVNGVQ